jgi:hypothetical protein
MPDKRGSPCAWTEVVAALENLKRNAIHTVFGNVQVIRHR